MIERARPSISVPASGDRAAGGRATIAGPRPSGWISTLIKLSPGRGPDFAELARKLSRAGEPVTTHLCIAASTRNEELDRIIHLYGTASPRAVLPTKLDEAVAIGTVLAARTRLGVPLSFATTGQQVPDDIALATPDFIIDLLLGDDRP